MGVDPQSYGLTELGKPQVERWVQFAFNQLCEKGFATRMGRGKWALTPAGVKEAMLFAPAEQKEPETIETEHPYAPSTPAPHYHEDLYIRELAAQATPCIGAFSAQSGLCRECPLQEMCLSAVAAELSRLAKTFVGSVPLPSEVEKTPSEKAPLLEASFSWLEKARTNRVTASRTAVCQYCGSDLEKGSSVVWAHKGSHSGLFHDHCYKIITNVEVP
jgi:hypothetical protein